MDMSGFRNNEGRIYVGNLPPDIRTKDIEDLFYKFGKIAFIDLKNRRGPPFAFVEFEDPRDAEDAVHARDGYNYDGYHLRVEFPRGTGPGGRRGRGRGGPPLDGQSTEFSFQCCPLVSKTEPHPSVKHGNNLHMKLMSGGSAVGSEVPIGSSIWGLPPTGSWQDLKDHMREAGDVCYADVYKDGTGVVEFLRCEDMKYAARKLDDSKFRSHEGEVAYIRVKEDYRGRGSHSRSHSLSPPRRARGSPSYSPMRRSRSRSPY